MDHLAKLAAESTFDRARAGVGLHGRQCEVRASALPRVGSWTTGCRILDTPRQTPGGDARRGRLCPPSRQIASAECRRRTCYLRVDRSSRLATNTPIRTLTDADLPAFGFKKVRYGGERVRGDFVWDRRGSVRPLRAPGLTRLLEHLLRGRTDCRFGQLQDPGLAAVTRLSERSRPRPRASAVEGADHRG